MFYIGMTILLMIIAIISVIDGVDYMPSVVFMAMNFTIHHIYEAKKEIIKAIEENSND